MVIERYPPSNVEEIGRRFEIKGRMMPEGVSYHASWVETTGARCFQLMEADSRESLDEWIGHWNDLVDFEVSPVLTSAEFWASR